MTLIIGDVHGCYDELRDLLDKCGAADDEPIYMLGDLIDKGLQPAEVFEFVRSRPNIESIRGNHEQKHIYASIMGSYSTAQDYTRQMLDERVYREWLQYIRNLPLYMDIGDAYLVHGYYEPGVVLHKQRHDILLGMYDEEPMFEWNNPDTRNWYEFYDGDKPIVVGHRNYNWSDEPLVVNDRVFGIDTSCVYGGALTALKLPEWEFISVPSGGSYWEMLKEKFG